MKTAVDVLWDMIPKDIQSMIDKQFDGHNQSKEIEKEQMIEFYVEGCKNTYGYSVESLESSYDKKEGIEYYNETYGGNK
jgi:hypothetical protein